MGFLRRLKNAFDPKFDELIQQFMRGDDFKVSDVAVDEYTALKYSAFFACCRVLSETFASVPIFQYRKLKDGDREPVTDTVLYDILHTKPNEEMSAYNFFECLMYQLCIGGNAVSQQIYNREGGIVGLQPIDWKRYTIERDKETKRIVYRVDQQQNLYRNQVFHLPGPSLDGINGMSVLEYATSAIRLGRTYETFGQNFYQNGAIPSGVFSHPGFLKDEAYDRLKKDLDDRYAGLTNSGRPILAEDGLTFKELTISPVDAQLIECKKLQIEDICRFCRVPLHLVQNLDKATNNNIEHQSLEFVMYTMLPHFKRAEEAVNAQLLTSEERRQGYYFEFNISTLLRGDAQSMANSFATGRQWGWLSVNDIRRLLNMNRVPNGDIYLQPSNMFEAGKEPPVSAPANPAEPMAPKKPRAKKGTSNSAVQREIDNLISEAVRNG